MKGTNKKWEQEWVVNAIKNDPIAYAVYSRVLTFEEFTEMLAQIKLEQCEELTTKLMLKKPGPVFYITQKDALSMSCGTEKTSEECSGTQKRDAGPDGKLPLTDQEKKEFASFLRDNVFDFVFNDVVTDVLVTRGCVVMRGANDRSYGEVDISGYRAAVEWLAERFNIDKELMKHREGMTMSDNLFIDGEGVCDKCGRPLDFTGVCSCNSIKQSVEDYPDEKEEPSPSAWFWKMQWCKQQGVAPADNYWWNEAEKAWQKYKKRRVI